MSLDNIINSNSNSIVDTPSVGSKVSRCMVINGDIKSCEPIVIDGRVVGSIESDDTVVVQRGGFVIGSISAKSVKIDSKVDGPIEANSVEIDENGLLEGYIIANNILIKGRSDGDILAKESLYIDKDAIVKTYETRASEITIDGKVIGDIVAINSINIKSNGVIEGNLLTKELKSQMGSKILGSINRYKDNNKTNNQELKNGENKVIRKVRRLR